MLKPKWKNWYLAIFYILSGGETFLSLGVLISWYVDSPFTYNLKILCLVHLLFSLALYVSTELFEFIWKRVC